jgi:serine/threonine-protein kinase
MGSVYLARDDRLDRQVAVKVLDEPLGFEVRHRLQREARTAARLNHPGIAAIYDFGEHEAQPYLVMEYVEGEPLSTSVDRGPLPVDRVLNIGIQLADVLDYAHREGVIHRDIKPANVVIARDERVKVLDLGVARVVLDAQPARRAPDDSATVGIKGTPAYMAPEQLMGAQADARSDIYSSGVLLFELLTGARPYDERDAVSLALALSGQQGPPDPLVRRPELPPAVADVVKRAMAHNPAERYQTAAALRDDLVRARQALSTAPTGTFLPSTAPARRPWMVVGLVAAVLGLAAIAAVWSLRDRRPPAHAGGPIAILPAVNLSGDPELEHLGAGLVSVLADNLSAVPGLTVVPAAATVSYRGTERDVAKAAAELGANYVVDLEVAGSGRQLRVEGRLLRSGLDNPVWADNYEDQPLYVQRELIDSVASALESERAFRRPLRASERERLRRLPTENADALAAYSRGVAALASAKDQHGVRSAIDAFEEAVRRDPEFALAHAGLSRALGSMYNHTREPVWAERADRAGRRALEIDPGRAEVHASMARVHRIAGRHEDALRHARRAVAIAPDSDEAHRLVGGILLDRGQAEGFTSLQRAIELRPDYWLNHFELGIGYYDLGRYQEALAPFRRLTQLRPDFAPGFQALGTIYHLLGDTQQAIGNYQHALRLAPEALAYSNLAFAYYTEGRFEEALSHWQKAIELEPTSPATHRNLGDAYARLNRTSEARAAYAEAITRGTSLLSVNPRDARTIALVALCEAKLGRLDEASRQAAEAVALAPADNEVLYKAAVVQALRGEPDAAVRQLDAAVRAGYPPAFARDDRDLQSLRDRPDFRKVVGASAQRGRAPNQ